MFGTQSPSIRVLVTPFLLAHSFTPLGRDSGMLFLDIGNNGKLHVLTVSSAILNISEHSNELQLIMNIPEFPMSFVRNDVSCRCEIEKRHGRNNRFTSML